MTHRFTLSLAVASFAIALSIAQPVLAEEMTLDQQVQFVRSITAAERQATLANAAAFTDEEAENFWSIYREYRNEVAALDDRIVALIRDLADNYESLTDAKATELSHEWLDVEKKRIAAKAKYLKKYEKILPGVKLARVLQVENRLDVLVQLRLARNVPLIRN